MLLNRHSRPSSVLICVVSGFLISRLRRATNDHLIELALTLLAVWHLIANLFPPAPCVSRSLEVVLKPNFRGHQAPFERKDGRHGAHQTCVDHSVTV